MMTALLLSLFAQASPSEEEAVQAIVKLFTGEPVVEKDKEGRTRVVKLAGRPAKAAASLSITFADGRVVALRGNGVVCL